MLYLCSLYISLTETVSNLSFVLVFHISVFIYNFFMNVIALCIAVDLFFTFSQFICICQWQCSHYHSIVTSRKCDNNKWDVHSQPHTLLNIQYSHVLFKCKQLLHIIYWSYLLHVTRYCYNLLKINLLWRNLPTNVYFLHVKNNFTLQTQDSVISKALSLN